MTSIALHHSGTGHSGAVQGFTAVRPRRAQDTSQLLYRPLLRGRLHQCCAAGSIPAGLELVRQADGGTRTAALAYALTWTAMFTTSAAYHRLTRTLTSARLMRRADHSMIFLHIGGAATALALLSLDPILCATMLAVVWAGVAAGVAIKVTRLVDGGSSGSWVYAVLGGSQVLVLPLVAATLSAGQLLLLLSSGAAYGVGAVLFFRKRPDPFPTVFGYHEVWHCFTVVGGLCQYLLILSLIGG